MTEYQQNRDKQLLSGLRKGDENAFEAFYERYWKEVFDQAFVRVRQHDVAENITQDIFVAIWDNRENLKIDNVPGYLYTAVRNRVLNWFEKEKRYVPIAELLSEVRASSDFSDIPLLEKELVRVCEALINSLSPSQQKIYRMRFEEELSTAEIADQLGMNRKTVQNQLSLALAQLRSSLTLLILLSRLF